MFLAKAKNNPVAYVDYSYKNRIERGREMDKTLYTIHLNYEDEIRITGNQGKLLIHDERVTIDEASTVINEFLDMFVDEKEIMKKTLFSLVDNFEVKSIGVEL
ncbi:MAG: hypothetical protein JHC33_10270 [Ignisphaera sp.]|nr:hypothetical protein [Ignisphaera sp.]